MYDYASSLWESLSPFKAFVLAYEAALRDILLRVTVLTVVCLAVAGGVALARACLTNLAPLAFVGLFYAYETVALVPQYFMWYLRRSTPSS